MNLDLRTAAHALDGEISSGQILCPGPGHSRSDRSLAVKLGNDDVVVFSHAGDDPIRCKDFVREKLGLPKWQPKQADDPFGRLRAHASNGDGTRPRYVASYIYKQADGTPYLRVSRTEPKGFPQSHWTGTGWASGKPKGPKIPYRLPELIAAASDVVFVVEGEKDADALAERWFTATTNSEGAGCWTEDLNPYFKDRTVFVLADNDQAGADHALKVARHLAPVAAEVRIVNLPGLPPKGDVSDWIAAGGDTATLVELCRTFKVFAENSADPKDDPEQARGTNESRPTIRVVAADIERIVDEAEAALIKAGRGLYQRGGLIVSVGVAKMITADGSEVGGQRIFERGEHALAEDLTAAAHFEKYNERVKDYVPCDAPSKIVKTLQQRTARLRLPPLSGVINAPTLRPDGSLLEAPGYDAATGLLFDPRGETFPAISTKPSRDDAVKALSQVKGLIETFPFVDEADRAVALSTILTACIRRTLGAAPLHAYTAPVAGSGKSMLVDLAATIATGREAGVVAQGRTEEETEKRLGALLLSGDPIIAIDNCEQPLGGEFLCQVLTQSAVRVRILGKSEAPELPTNSLITATGNNLVLVGDMTRRGLLCHLDPRVERPELRQFERNPIAAAKANRGQLVAAVLTVLRAYQVAGRPAEPSALGSFAAWSSLVRGALMWLGEADPVDTMERARSLDPRLEELSAVLTQWREVIGKDAIIVRRLIEKATKQTVGDGFDYSTREFTHPDFREALLTVAGTGGAVNSRRLGKWLSANKNRIVGGLWIEQGGIFEGKHDMGAESRKDLKSGAFRCLWCVWFSHSLYFRKNTSLTHCEIARGRENNPPKHTETHRIEGSWPLAQRRTGAAYFSRDAARQSRNSRSLDIISGALSEIV